MFGRYPSICGVLVVVKGQCSGCGGILYVALFTLHSVPLGPSVFWMRQLVLCKTEEVEDVVSYGALRPIYEDYYLSVSLSFMCIFSGLVWNHQFNAFIKQG